MTQNEEHLKLISIFHYVVGGLAALFSLFPVIHLVIGIFLVAAPQKFSGGHSGPPPAFFGWLFIIFPALIIVLGLTMAGFILATGRFIAQRKRYMFCFVVAAVECLFMPFGTVLGVFTLIVLLRPAVKELFGAAPMTTTGTGAAA